MSNIILNNDVKVSGHYEFYKNGELVGFSDNVITNGFFNRLINRSTDIERAWCVCGSGTTEPQATDTTLESPIPSAIRGYISYDQKNNYFDGNNYWNEFRYTFTFGAGTFTGTVTEVGVRLYTSTSNPGVNVAVDSRVLIKDGTGSVTPVTISGGDIFIVIFRIKSKVPNAASTTVNIEGNTHTITWEPLSANNWYPAVRWDYWYYEYGHVSGARVITSQGLFNDPSSTTIPTGTNQWWGSNYNSDSYSVWETSAGSEYKEVTTRVILSASQLSNGVEYIQFFAYNSNQATAQTLRYGVHFDPVLTSPAAESLYLTNRWTFSNF